MVNECQRQSRPEALLEGKRKELLLGIRAHASELAIADGVHDPADRVQVVRLREEAVGELDRLTCALASVQAALSAIANGSYGFCAKCGKPIAAKRLESIPWAAHCLVCQTEVEQQVAEETPAWLFDPEDEAA